METRKFSEFNVSIILTLNSIVFVMDISEGYVTRRSVSAIDPFPLIKQKISFIKRAFSFPKIQKNPTQYKNRPYPQYFEDRGGSSFYYSTVTLLAKFLGLSTSQPRVTAA
ncbi:MAG: hypothetical protein K0R78_668 [Pelosinus sp.]|jgi:hypothetical protein|nr:hypothetical protein [Pelosinus sp.]